MRTAQRNYFRLSGYSKTFDFCGERDADEYPKKVSLREIFPNEVFIKEVFLKAMSFKKASFRNVQTGRRNICRRPVILSAAVFSAVCMIIICTAFFGSLHSNANNGFKYYTSIVVQPGETLWELADQYIDYDHYKDKQSYISEVININHLEEDVICAGQMLVVPYYSSEYIY